MPIRNIYMDEAGYTGTNLLDQGQPFLYVSAVCFSEKELLILQRENPLPLKFSELHFSKLYHSKEGRKFLVKIYSHYLLDKVHVKKARLNKRFALYAKVIDLLIEPIFYKNGIDLYAKGYQYLMAIHLYKGMVSHKDQNLVCLFETLFAKVISDGSNRTISRFKNVIHDLLNTDDGSDRFKELLNLLFDACEDINGLTHDQRELEMTKSLIHPLVVLWRERREELSAIIFDNSKPINNLINFLQTDLLEWVENDVDKTHFHQSSLIDELKILRERLQIMDSAKCYGIQIADIVASGAAFIRNNNNPKMEPFKNQLLELPLFKQDDWWVDIDYSH